MKPVTWGVLSVSGHYRLRVSAPLRHSEIVDVRAIASRSLDRARAAGADMGIPRAYGSYEELLADSSIEAVYIPLPNHMHVEWVKKAADAGKHVLCEKPLALHADEVSELIEHTNKRGVLLMEAFMYRYHPQWIRARELVQIGEVGRVTAVQSSFFYNNRDPKNIRNRTDAGGGALLDIGCYTASSARYLLGREPERVVSLVQRDPDFGTDRLTSALLDFGDVQAQFTVGTQTYSEQTVTIWGSGGFLRVELPFNAFPDVPINVHVSNGVGSRDIATGPADQYRLQFEAFSRALRSGDAPPTPPEDALANQRVLDAIFRSEKSGGWERVG